MPAFCKSDSPARPDAIPQASLTHTCGDCVHTKNPSFAKMWWRRTCPKIFQETVRRNHARQAQPLTPPRTKPATPSANLPENCSLAKTSKIHKHVDFVMFRPLRPGREPQAGVAI